MATQVVALADVERLSASVIRILGGNPGKVSRFQAQPIEAGAGTAGFNAVYEIVIFG